jgi:hypothetical protein
MPPLSVVNNPISLPVLSDLDSLLLAERNGTGPWHLLFHEFNHFMVRLVSEARKRCVKQSEVSISAIVRVESLVTVSAGNMTVALRDLIVESGAPLSAGMRTCMTEVLRGPKSIVVRNAVPAFEGTAFHRARFDSVCE